MILFYHLFLHLDLFHHKYYASKGICDLFESLVFEIFDVLWITLDQRYVSLYAQGENSSCIQYEWGSTVYAKERLVIKRSMRVPSVVP